MFLKESAGEQRYIQNNVAAVDKIIAGDASQGDEATADVLPFVASS